MRESLWFAYRDVVQTNVQESGRKRGRQGGRENKREAMSERNGLIKKSKRNDDEFKSRKGERRRLSRLMISEHGRRIWKRFVKRVLDQTRPIRSSSILFPLEKAGLARSRFSKIIGEVEMRQIPGQIIPVEVSPTGPLV